MNWLKLKRNNIYTVCFFLLGLTAANGQSLTDLATKYSSYPEVILRESESYNIEVEKGNLKVSRTSYFESMILSEVGIQNDDETFFYSTLLPVEEYEAYTILPETKKSKKVEVEQESESSGKADFVFHDDVKQKKLSYLHLEPGAKKVLKYKTIYKDASLMNGQSFSRHLPAEYISLEVRCDKNVELGYKIMNDIENAISFSTITEGSKVIYKWESKNVSAIKQESNTPGFLHVAPHVIVYVKSYKNKDKVFPFLGNESLLHQHYLDFIKDLNKTEDVELKKIALELTKEVSDEEEKVKKIFYWVKSNIKYIAFESGYEGFVPRQASLVYDRKYGDCKDMASIITAMCQYAGIKNVNLCWIGTREIPYSYREVPTPSCDNHMIAAYKNAKNEIIFLDATSAETKYGLPTSFIQGKEAMVNKSGNDFEIVKVGIVEASANTIVNKINVALDGTKLAGKGKIAMDGYARSGMLASMGDLSGTRRFDFIKSRLQMGNNKFGLKSYDENNVADIEKPYEINYEFDLGNYAVKTGDDIYINLLLSKPYEKSLIEKDRLFDYEFDHLQKHAISISLEVPPHSEIINIPENFQFDNDLFACNINYSKSEHLINVDYTLELKKINLSRNDFALWNDALVNLRKHYGDVIVLKNQNK